ncbi:MAG: hypothetical protein MJZ31_09735 [Bacteroidales bacterium]|nr:hypothetical protein [Bacteroidales bacterium]
MSNIENFDARLELFLKNKMTKEESNIFLGELQDNPDLRERAQTMAAAIKNMKELNYEHGQRVASKIEQVSVRNFREAAHLPQKARVISLMSIVSKSIAACFIGVIILGSYRYYIYNETVTLGDSYYAAIPTELVIRDADEVPSQLTLLFNHVKDGKDLDNTILNLQEKFSLAISEDYNDYTNYINDIGWNLAIAHLKEGERDDAVKTLELLISHSESDIVIEKCKKLIEEIKEL